MSVTVRTCTQCHEELRVPDRYRGRELKCPQCGKSFSIPAPAPTPDDQRAAAPAAPAAGHGPPSTAGTRGPSEATGPRGLGGWMAVIMGWMALVTVATLYQYLQIHESLADTRLVQQLEREAGEYLQYLKIAEIANLGMVFGMVIALLFLFSYRKLARVLAITVVAVSLGLGIWDVVWVTQVFDQATPAGYLFGRVAVCLLVIAYFLGSQRVKNTFVK